MPKYIILSKITSEGLETLKENPRRIKEVNEEIANKYGVKVLQQFLVMGPYDFVNIVEAPDNNSVVKMAVELGSRGTVETMTMPALDAEEFIKLMSK
ncbi:MAG: GYD domain-containing protein [Candidatus Calescibacterium sp.]|nr:GYD domain-containing protein [Candidatus Calescibacterium sp.]MCX7733342.1 GYD domain-containing protein [bacterium]MDW8086736.1 GYD domain-containing protein [Candidatus Calescibacterium sp.]